MRLFSEHPRSLGESYWQHFLKAVKFSYKMLLASAACFIHAWFPFLFETAATDLAKQIVDCNEERKRAKPKD
jgi:hypothetical protein